MGRYETCSDLRSRMRAVVFVLIVGCLVGAQAGCEWYKNCGACVADSGCGWCSNDPTGTGTGSLSSGTTDSSLSATSINDDGTAGKAGTKRVGTGPAAGLISDNGVEAGELIGLRGQYNSVASAVDTTNPPVNKAVTSAP